MSFKDPNVSSRPVPLWSWNDNLQPEELRRQIREMAAQGYGGFFMHPRIGYTTHYLSDKWMAAVKASVDEAQKQGIKAWLYDEDRWPSGYGAGVVAEEHIDYRSRCLGIRPKGTEKPNDTVLEEVSIRGQAYVITIQVSNVGREWYNGSTYPDLMNPDAMRVFLDKVLERYKQACGEHFGKTIPGVFTDEPLYLDNSAFDALAVPWSTKLPAYFQKLHGYDIRKHLPKLFLDEGDFRKIRFDFYDAASKLFRDSFTKQYFDWCDKNKLLFVGHFQAEDNLRLQIQWTGDVMAHYPHMHWPGIDQLERHVDEVALVKQLTSVTDQLDKPRAFCECYGISGVQVAFFHRKWISDWLIALGINFIDPHLSHYSLRGPRKRDCPPNIGPQAAWWPDERGLSDYIARLCELFTGGKRRLETLLIQPLTSVWADYSPLQWDSGYAPVTVYDKPYQEMARKLLASQVDFHIGNETIMKDHGRVTDGLLYVGRHGYKTVVLPPMMNIRSSTVALLKDFLAQGGRVIVTGAGPAFVDGVATNLNLPGATYTTRAAQTIEETAKHAGQRVTATDAQTGKLAAQVVIHTRDGEAGTAHMLVNTAEARDVSLRVQIPASDRAHVAIFDARSGSVYAAPVREDGTLEVTLAPAGALVLLTGEHAEGVTQPCPVLVGSGATVPGLNSRASGPALAVASRFDVSLLSANVLRVDEATLSIAGKEHTGAMFSLWPHFFGVEDGTPFTATYHFDSACALSGCQAAIDSAEHLDSITFNGEAITPLRAKGDLLVFNPETSWHDIAFTRVPLPGIKAGRNTLTIIGRKVNVAKPSGASHRRTQPGPEPVETQLEDVFILGNFLVQGAGGSRFGLAAPAPLPTGNLTQCGAPFYNDRALFETSVVLVDGVKNATLYLHGLQAASARVSVNGKPAGTLRWQPYALDVSGLLVRGKNRIAIELSTTPFNAMGPTRLADAQAVRRVHIRQFSDLGNMASQHDLAPFGLEGISVVE